MMKMIMPKLRIFPGREQPQQHTHISPNLPSEDKDGGEDPDDEVLFQSEDEGSWIAPEVLQGDPEEEGTPMCRVAPWRLMLVKYLWLQMTLPLTPRVARQRNCRRAYHLHQNHLRLCGGGTSSHTCHTRVGALNV